jgi:hypothetical protein
MPHADDVQTDRRGLEAVADAVGVEPDDPICPDLDRLAKQDGDFPAKVQMFQAELKERFRQRRTGRL